MADREKSRLASAFKMPPEAGLTSRVPESGFDPDSVCRMRDMIALGLTPSSALDLLTHLIGEIPTASKENMDRLKMLDKFLNTARAMIETRLKTEEAAAIAARLDEMENRLAALVADRPAAGDRAVEVWDDRSDTR